jgi:hypothetical protein
MEHLSITDQNLRFINLGSEPTVIPKEFQFLRKYFKTKLQKVFLDYYFVFRSAGNFEAHTGHRIGAPSVSKLSRKFDWLMGEYYQAKSNMDLDLLSKLKRRRVKLLKKFS